jgi:hypothetical protein
VLHLLESVVAVSSANDGVDTSLVALVIPTSCSRLIAASRSCIADDTDALVPRVSDALARCVGNADQTRAAIDAEPRARIHRSNNAGHDRRQYRDRPRRGSQRRENGGLSLAPADNAQPTNHQPCTDAAFRRVLRHCRQSTLRCGKRAFLIARGPSPSPLSLGAQRRQECARGCSPPELRAF